MLGNTIARKTRGSEFDKVMIILGYGHFWGVQGLRDGRETGTTSQYEGRVNEDCRLSALIYNKVTSCNW